MQPFAFETLAVHAGIEPDESSGAVMTPIYQTSTFAQIEPGQHRGFEYARTDNPTRSVLQNQLAALEGADRSLVFSSGMASIDALLNLLGSGDHVVASDDLYGGTRRLFTRIATQRGIEFTFVDLTQHSIVESSMRPSTKMVWIESPTNPMMKLVDIRRICAIARTHGALSVVDNTFMSPYFQRPLDLGADVSMHSMTKYINGHSDVVMGALMVREPKPMLWDLPEGMGLAERLKFLQNSIGAVPGPFDCFLVLRGIKTLAVRMDRIGSNAMKIASWLDAHPRVVSTIYPGLESHPQHELAKSQASGFGGMLSFYIDGGEREAKAFLSELKLFTVAESLGGVESLAEHPAIMTHASVPPLVRAELGIADNLVRLSIGIESADDLIADLESALKSI